MKKKAPSLLKSAVVVAVLFIGFLFIDRQMNTWLGQQALAASELNGQPLEVAMVMAGKTGKPVLANFSAIWCPACRTLEKNVLSDAGVIEEINSNFHYARLEYESETGQTHFPRYGVNAFPALKIIDANGNVIRSLVPVTDAGQLLSQLSAAR